MFRVTIDSYWFPLMLIDFVGVHWFSSCYIEFVGFSIISIEASKNSAICSSMFWKYFRYVLYMFRECFGHVSGMLRA